MQNAIMKELVKTIVCAMVDNPHNVSTSVTEGAQTSVIELSVAKNDLGKVIGKKGRNADAIRTILSAVSSKYNKRAVLEIIE
jgi:predicted RNA-binding protein YlqC (UPF0109 family)